MPYLTKERKRRFVYTAPAGTDMKDLPYKPIAVREPVFEEFRELADKSKAEYTRLLQEMIKEYKRKKASEISVYLEFP